MPPNPPLLARFYLIIDSLDDLDGFLAAGVRCVQLRVKSLDTTSLRAMIRDAQDRCTAAGCQLIVNDHWQLAIDAGATAVHLGQGDLDTADTAALRDAGLRIGISTHDRAELQRALAEQPDYIALGPIYATLLKKMPWRPQGLDKLLRWKSAVGDIPLVAIGGFTPERAQGAFAHGADSVCVVTDVLQHAQPVERVRQWLTVTARQPASH